MKSNTQTQHILHQEILLFIEYNPIHKVKSNLGRLLFAYLQANGNEVPKYHQELLSQLEALNDLLDAFDFNSSADLGIV